MTNITRPLILDETGKEMINALKGIEGAIRGYAPEAKQWSITINLASGAFPISAMGGDVTAWRIYRQKIGRYLVKFPDEKGISKAHKCDVRNSNQLEDGTEIDTNAGNVLVRLPRFYANVDTSGDLVTVTMCEREFVENCEEFDEQWVGAYFGWLDGSGRLRSIPKVNPTRGRQIRTFWNDAQKNGSNYGLHDYNQWRMLVLLYLCEFLDKESQACLGNGMTGTGNNWCETVYNAITGDTAELGDECGKVPFNAAGQNVGGACHVSLFGIEDPYGWFWTMMQGMYFGNSGNEAQTGSEAFAYEGNRMPTDNELTTHPTGVYRQLTRVVTSGWLQTIIAGAKFDVIPASIGSNRWGDYHWVNNTGQLLLLGGGANNGSNCGLVFSGSGDAFSYSSSSIGARLAHYGNQNIEIVHPETEK